MRRAFARLVAVCIVGLFCELIYPHVALAVLPHISSFTPTSGVAGDIVTINGSGFTSGPWVTFQGSPNAEIVSSTFGQIIVKVHSSALTGPITVSTIYGSVASSTSFTVPAPTITGFSPTYGPAGTSVTITGTNFAADSTRNIIRFNGIAAAASSVSATSITAIVPPTATTGPITVRVGTTQTATSSSNFMVGIAPPPTIASFSPSAGPVGATVVISGTNFSATPSADIVKFNGTAATVSAASTTSLTVAVPAGASTGPIQVTVGGQTATSGTNFTVAPVITSFSPSSGPVGTSVTISGTNFSTTPSANSVTFFNGVAATVSAATATSLTVAVPAGATTGPVTATVGGQSATSGTNFTVTPAITGFSPSNGVVGTVVIISGTNFGATIAANTVTFNGVTASLTAATATSLTAVVPLGASTGPISVSVGGQSVTSSNTFSICYELGTVSTFAGLQGTSGSADGTGSTARFSSPGYEALDAAGNLYVSDGLNNTIRKITPSGVVSTFAGSPGVAGSLDGTGTAARFNAPTGLAFDSAGNLYVGDYANNKIRKITPAAVVSTFAGSGLAGSADGAGSAASFNAPQGIGVDVNGNVYVSDSGNYTIRKITSAGVVSTLAGHVGQWGFADGAGSAATFDGSRGLAVDSVGQVYVADYFANTIRVISPAGVVSTLAGIGWAGGPANFADGPGSAARFQKPWGVAVDRAGNLYVADSSNQAIRKISGANAMVTTLAGSGSIGSADGTGVLASFNIPLGIAVDGNGVVYVADSTNDTIRKLVPTAGCTAPVISSISPSAGTAGTNVTIAGNYFSTTPSQNALFFNGQPAVVTAATSTSLSTTVPNLALTGPVTVTVGGESGSFNTFAIPAPTISGFTPTSGPGGTQVTISGSNFAAAPQYDGVSIYGNFGSVSPTSTGSTIYATIPANAVSGPIQVTVGGFQSATTTAYFTVTNAPTITGFSPGSGTIGTTVTVTGANFSTTPSANSVTFNGAAATVSAATTTSLTVAVPIGATTGPISVTVGGQTATSSTNFTVTQPAPTITGFSPGSGPVGTAVSITGTNFSTTPAANGVTFFNNVAATVSAATTTSLTVTVPGGAATGVIKVTVGGQTATSSNNFTVTTVPPPTITSVSPSSACVGTAVAITGTNFGATAAADTVSFNGTPAIVNSGNSTSISTTVPGGATSGTLTVTVGGQSATGTFTVTSCTAPTAPALPPAATSVNDLPSHDATVGTMAGQAGTDGGAATYTIPIVVPPGRAGMQPSLSLNYNSRSGNGVMGVGWTISGLSSIHRCPQTPEQDSQTLGVSYTSNDRLCLDGQRLVAVTGTYGSSGAEYRTEVDSYARSTQTGGGLTGTATCFRVEQKDGRILHYGAVTNGSPTPTSCAASSANSRVSPTGAAGTLSWLVERIEDRVGNNQLYSYVNYGNGEVLLQSVQYTGFTPTSTAGDRKATFLYTTRTSAPAGCATDSTKCATDTASSYLAGGLTMQTKALLSITTAIGTTTVRTYTPTYAAAAYSGRLLMTNMQECATNAGTTACHPQTHFVYNDDPINTPTNFPLTSLTGFLPGVTPDPTITGSPYITATVGDIDGDGTREVAAAATTSTGTKLYLVQLTADRQVHSAVDLTGTGFSVSPSQYADVDGSGRSALIELPQSAGVSQVLSFATWKLARGALASTVGTPAQNAAAVFNTYASNITFHYGNAGAVYAGDFNGDGKTDIAVVDNDTNCSSGRGVFLWLNTMSPTAGPLTPQTALNFAPTNGANAAFCLNSGAGGIQSVDHTADFDGNGLPDFYVRTTGATTHFDGVWLLAPNGSGGVSVSLKSCTQMGLEDSAGATTDDCTWSGSASGAFATQWIDVNGDGLEDLVLARPNQGTWRVLLNKGGTMGAEINTGSSAGLRVTGNLLGFRYAGRLPAMDIDADGKPELLTPSETQGPNSDGFAMKVCTVFKVDPLPNAGGCPDATLGGPMSPSAPQGASGAQCPAYSCPENPGSDTAFMPQNLETQGGAAYPYAWADAVTPNATLPAFGTYHSTKSNGFDNSTYHLAMLKFVQLGASTISVNVIETPLISGLSNSNGIAPKSDGLFGDGLSHLLTEVGCANTQVTYGSPGDIGYFSYNACSVVGTSGGITYGPTTLPDGSSTASFNTTAALYANINQGTTDIGGSPLFALKPGQEPVVPTIAQTTAAAALQPAAVLPGLLDGVVNGLGDSASWGYLPLAVPTSQGGVPLYSIQSTGGYSDSRHYYFASSMPVVFGMLQSSGTGEYGGFRTAVYGYSQAMYNRFGRGFQGFQAITSISGDTVNGTDRFVRTVTTYNQKFPLVGKVAQVTTYTQDSTGASVHRVRNETDTWICNRSNRLSGACPLGDLLPTPTSTTATSSGTAAYQPLLDKQIVSTYDLGNGALTAEVDTINAASSGSSTSGWDSYSCGSGSLPFGNLNDQIVTTYDKGSNLFVSGHTAATQTCYDTAGSATWWVNKLIGSTATTSIAYAAGHPLPAGATAPSQTVAAAYTWNSDRTPQTKTVQGGVANQQSTTTYCYPGVATSGCTATGTSYGLPAQVQVYAPDLAAALSPTRTTSYKYTKDGTTVPTDGSGYFVYTTTNGLSQQTTTNVQTTDGQVTTAIDPNGVQVVTTYDPFGRPTKIDHLGNNGLAFESSVQSAYTTCSSGSCGSGVGEDGYQANAAYRVTTVQAGHPTQVTWYDLLGRSIKHAEAVYSGVSGSSLTYKFSATLTHYDDVGTVSEQFSPYSIGTSPTYFTSFVYDALNRPTVKIAPGAEPDPTHGDVETDYTYNGRQTSIKTYAKNVSTAGTPCSTSSTTNLCLQMTRTTNALGQLMQTTELPVLAVGSTHLLPTNYWTEPQGHVVAITDAEGNITRATYNALGQRTQSVDPDQGTWNFTYDALGELLTQTDARSVVTTVLARDALGRTTQRQATPTGGVLTGMANEATYDKWTFDPANGIGEVDTILRRRGTSLLTPSSNPIVWQESYGYEAATARPSTATTTISEGSAPLNSVVSQTSYDTYGRVYTHQYPSGLTVRHAYTAYGQLDALSNDSTGYVYWAGLGQNQWSHTTKEQFPGVITGNYVDYNSTGQAKSLGWTGSTADQMTYGYDSFRNLTKQTRAVPYSNSETYTYDAAQRLTQTSRTSGNIVSYGYSDSGNIVTKTDFGTGSYSYGAINTRTSGCGPHAVYAVGSTIYSCDANGNVIGGNTLTMTFDPNNQARTATRGGSGSITWAYNALGERDYEVDTAERYFVGDDFRVEGANKRHELGPVIVTRNGSTDTIAVALRDRLGSTLNIIDSGAPTAREYDAFGKPRNGDMTDRAPPTLATPDTIFGFTNHEHNDSVLLIHMKGRVFDYQLGRFLGVDPVIGGALGSQLLNPYSYVGNNPLSGTDPTGYQAVVDNCTAPTGSHICGASTAAGKSTVTGHETTTDPSTGKTTTRTFVGTVEGKELTSIRETSSSSGSVVQNAKGPGGQNTQNVSPADAGNPNAPSNGVQQRAPIYGNAQESSKTPTHASTSERIANDEAQKPDTKRVHLNQSLRTVTGDPGAPNVRPDVTVVKGDESIDMHEVTSLRQTTDSQVAKLNGVRPQLGRPGSNFVVEPDPIIRGFGILGIGLTIFHEYVNWQVGQKPSEVDPCASDPSCI